MHIVKIFIALLIPILLASQSANQPRNIILMVGDGMALSHITAAQYHKGSALQMSKLPVAGFMTTHAANDLITDSAAAGTALSTGERTNNKYLGMNPEGKPINHLIPHLHRKKMKTGLLVTCSITHATPAGFFAHQLNREHHEAIALDFLHSDIDLIIGGGRQFFEQRKTDSRDLVTELNNKDYTINHSGSMNWSKYMEESSISKLAFFTADDHPGKKSEGRDYLPQATTFALNFLNSRSESGFFILIEGAQIDWGGHDRDTDYVIEETLDFDDAVGRALDFAIADGNTLLVVLADHETGGMAIAEGSKLGQVKAVFASSEHTGTMVPVMSYGPGSTSFSGFLDITDISKRILELVFSE